MGFLSTIFSNTTRAYQFYQFTRFLPTVIVGIVLVNSGYSTIDISIYEMSLFIGYFLTFFWSNGFGKAMLTSLPKLDTEERSNKLASYFWLSLAIGGIISLVIYFLQDLLIDTLTAYSSLPHMGWISLIFFFAVPSTLIEIIFLIEKRAKDLVTYGSLFYSAFLICVIVPAINQMDLGLIFINLAVLYALRFCYLIYLVKGSVLRPIPRKTTFMASLGLLFPLSLQSLAGGGMDYIDGFLASSLSQDEGIFAIYRYGAREFPIFIILINAFVTASIPIVAESGKDAYMEIKRQLTRFMNWSFPLAISMMLISPVIFPLLFSEEFIMSALLFNIYLLILSSRVVVPQIMIIAQEKVAMLMWFSFIELALNILLSIGLFQWWGIAGIAAASFIAFEIHKCMLVVYAYKKLGVMPWEYLSIKHYIGWNTTLFLIFFITLNLYSWS